MRIFFPPKENFAMTSISLSTWDLPASAVSPVKLTCTSLSTMRLSRLQFSRIFFTAFFRRASFITVVGLPPKSVAVVLGPKEPHNAATTPTARQTPLSPRRTRGWPYLSGAPYGRSAHDNTALQERLGEAYRKPAKTPTK